MDKLEHPYVEAAHASKQPSQPMNYPDARTVTDKQKGRAHEMLDEPILNPRYGGRTMRRVVIKALRRM